MHEPKSRVAIEALTCLLSDLESITGEDLSRDRTYSRNLFAKSGEKGLLTVLQQHKDILYRFFATGLPLQTGTVRVIKRPYPVPLFLKEVWEHLYDDFDNQPKWADLLLQVFSLLSKWDSVPPGTEGCAEEFLKRVGSHANGAPGPSQAFWLTGIQKYLHRWLSGPLTGTYHTSGGACFDKRPVLQRPLVLSRQVRFNVPDPEHEAITWEDGPLANRLVVVPKDWRRNRVVCVERVGNVNAQQYARSLIECAARTTDLGRRIDFDDQEHQRDSLRLSGRSSIDLSDASDYVDACVVWTAFRRLPQLRSLLFSCRSTKVLYQGQEYPVRCYATMGNATTFAVMSAFLCALTACVEDYCYRYCKRRPRVSTVFGDDIVCDDWIAGTVITVLRQFGFKVNATKTFIGQRFKESCGVDLFDGVNITPLKLKGLTGPDQASLVDRAIDYSNRAHKAGYWRLADYLRRLAAVPIPCNFGERSLHSFSQGFQLSGCEWVPDVQNFVFPAIKSRLYESDTLQNYFYSLNKAGAGRQGHGEWPRLRASEP